MWWRQKPSPRIEAALTLVRIFAALSQRDLRKLTTLCLLKDYAAGETILEEGSTGLGLFIITSGRVEIFKIAEVSKTADAERIQLAVLGHGDVLGEMALLDDQPRSASAVALEPTECLLLSRGRFRALLKSRSRVAWPIVPALARRVRDLQAQLITAKSRALEVSTTSTPETANNTSLNDTSPNGTSPKKASPAAPPTPVAERLPESAATTRETSILNPMRAQVALLKTGVTGLDESARLIGVFLHAFEEEIGLYRSKPLEDIARGLPSGLFKATRSSLDAGLQMPGKMVDSFRNHLRADRTDRG